MRIIHCECSATYTGRGDTILPKHQRIIIMKNDGSVMIHSDDGIKPLNYMTNKPKLSVYEETIGGVKTISFENTKESLTITMHHVYSDMSIPMPEGDPGLIHDGTEAQLQEWLADNITVLNEHYQFSEREFGTDNGPVDLLAFNTLTGRFVLIEVKRTATTAAIHQVRRYVDGVEDNPDIVEPECLLVAYNVAPKARAKAESLGVPWVELEKTGDGYQRKTPVC